MFGLGTIINTVAVLVGGLIGLLCNNIIPRRVQEDLPKAIGIAVMFMSIAETLKEMFTVNASTVQSNGTLMMIVCIVLGTLVGSLIDIDKRFEQFGSWLKRKTKSENDSRFLDGFITTSLTVCVGAMAVVGAIQDGLTGDYSMLLAKSILDFIMLIIMTSSLGKGCIFSVIPVILLQGGFTLFAKVIEPLLTPTAISNLSLTGSVLIFCVGLNLVRKNSVKVANMLPAIVFAVAWAFLPI